MKWFAIRRTDAENRRDEDVLERRDEEQRRVLETDNVQLVGVDHGRDIPGSRNLHQVKSTEGNRAPRTHHVCDRTKKNVKNCTPLMMTI
jgi:hypothetical protein